MNNDEKERLRSVLVTLTIAMPSGEQVRQALFEQIESLFDEPEERPVMGPQMNCGPLKITEKEMTAKELVVKVLNENFIFTPRSMDEVAYQEAVHALLAFMKKEAGL